MKQTVLIAAPYVGELGWELFAWQPMVRAQYLEIKPDKCIVFAGKGRNHFYSFADAVRTVDGIPPMEAECMGWHNMNQYMDLFNQVQNTAKKQIDLEFPNDKFNVRVFSYHDLPTMNQPYYERGEPDLLVGDDAQAGKLVGAENDLVALCVRDRAMADYRNWSYKNWYDLGAAIVAMGQKPVYIGLIRDQAQWRVPDGAIDLTGRTSIDQATSVIANRCKLAVGGSTGLTHLASRCGVDHIVWGIPKNVPRYNETNWFGASCKVIPTGWIPSVQSIVDEVKAVV